MLGLAVNLSLYKASLFMVRQPQHERTPSARWNGSRASPGTGGGGCSGWGLDSRFHGNDGVEPLAVRMV